MHQTGTDLLGPGPLEVLMGLLGAVPIIGGALDAISGVTSAINARNAFKHRYQDTVKDMKAAGLNPALAYGQGGGNPQTSDLPDVGSAITRGVQTAASAKQAQQQAELTGAQANLLKAQTADLLQQTALRTQLMSTANQTRLLDFQGKSQNFDAFMKSQQAKYTADLQRPEQALQATSAARWQNVFNQLAQPEAQAESTYYKGLGRYEPYTNQFLNILKGVMPKIQIGGTSAGAYAPRSYRR